MLPVEAVIAAADKEVKAVSTLRADGRSSGDGSARQSGGLDVRAATAFRTYAQRARTGGA